MGSLTIEIGMLLDVSGLCTSGWSIDNILKAVGILEELSIHDFVILVSIYRCDIVSIVVKKREAKSSQYLTENLGRYFKVSMAIEILEEALCVKPVLSDKFSEIFDNALHISLLSCICLRSSIDNICTT